MTNASADAVPAFERRERVDRVAVDVDLEVQMAADGAGIAGLADAADALAGPDAPAAVDARRADHVGIEVAAVLSLAVDQQIVAVEDRVVAGAQHAPGRHGDERRAAGSDDVETFVRAPARPRRAEFADGAARPVRPLDRKDVSLELGRPVAIDALCRRRRGERGEQDQACEESAPQWCSMTRSTMLYSFASSAVMK